MPKSRGPTFSSLFRLQDAGVFYALVLIVVTFGILTSHSGRTGYLSSINVANVLDQSSMMAVLVVFMTVVLVSGNFDLSVAATAALSAQITLQLIDHHNLALVCLLCLTMGALVGLLNGSLVQFLGVNAFIVTLATMTAVRGIVFLTSQGTSVTADTGPLRTMVVDSFAFNARTAGVVAGAAAVVLGLLRMRRQHNRDRTLRAAWVPLVAGGLLAAASLIYFPTYFAVTHAVLILLVVAVIVWAVMTFTVVGRRLYAVGSNAEAARLSGINVNGYRIGAFVASGVASAAVGLMFAGRYESMNPQALQGAELTVLTAAILGGTSLFGGVGSVIKSVTGALILAALANGMNFQQINSAWQSVIEGCVLVTAAGAYTVAARRSATGTGGPKEPDQVVASPQPTAATRDDAPTKARQPAAP